MWKFFKWTKDTLVQAFIFSFSLPKCVRSLFFFAWLCSLAPLICLSVLQHHGMVTEFSVTLKVIIGLIPWLILMFISLYMFLSEFGLKWDEDDVERGMAKFSSFQQEEPLRISRFQFDPLCNAYEVFLSIKPEMMMILDASATEMDEDLAGVITKGQILLLMNLAAEKEMTDNLQNKVRTENWLKIVENQIEVLK